MALNELTRSTVHVGGLVVGLDEPNPDGTAAIQIWTCSGVPEAGTGKTGDWALSQNGHIYANTDDGTWTEKV
jgi:hypothetical protein